jgi:hypothetical protein
MVHKSHCTINDREKLDLMESNEIRAPVEFSVIITAEYGAETWVLSEADELHLGVFERKILRRIYGPICEEATWRSRYNEEQNCIVCTMRLTW